MSIHTALPSAKVERIGVLGTGVQARLQVQLLAPLFETRVVVAWGRDRQRLEAYRADLAQAGFEVVTAESPAGVAALSQLIVTTTPSTEPLLQAADIRPGTHITAIGSDTAEKQELAADVLETELEMGVLPDRVVPGIERQRPDRRTL